MDPNSKVIDLPSSRGTVDTKMEISTELPLNLFSGHSEYLGSVTRNGQLCDYYQITANEGVSYIYIRRNHES